MSGEPQLGWLHLTDLHAGGEDYLWPGVEDDVLEDFAKPHALCGPWQVVFFTGDLVNSGKAEEYRKFEELRERILKRVRELNGGSEPIFLAVPGNHDVTRWKERVAVLYQAEAWHRERALREKFWSNPDQDLRRGVGEALQAWTAWSGGVSRDRVDYRPGLLPGDFSASFEVGRLSVGVVGLNSTFLQLEGGDLKERLALDVRQINAVCEPSAPDWAKRHHVTFLLTHHPPGWLEAGARKHFRGEIAPSGKRFDVHFCGHQHDARISYGAEGGSQPRLEVLGRSLFGIEFWGEGDNKVKREHGYSAGRIRVDGDSRAFVRLWPRKYEEKGHEGEWHIVADPRIDLPDGSGTDEWEIVRRGRPTLPGRVAERVTDKAADEAGRPTPPSSAKHAKPSPAEDYGFSYSSESTLTPVTRVDDFEALFTWVHLSDVHFGHGGPSRQHDQRLVLEALTRDVCGIRRSGPPRPDAVVVTGDLAFSGAVREAGEYERFAAWLDGVLQCLQLGPRRAFLVPGNHDVQREGKNATAAERLLQSLRQDEGPEGLDRALDHPDDRELLRKRQENYHRLAAGYGPPVSPESEWNPYWRHEEGLPDGLTVRLVGINTALLCVDDNDKSKLKVGRTQIAAALAEPLPVTNELVVVLAHHPMGWLGDEAYLRLWLSEHADVYLCGHIHDEQSERLRGGDGSELITVVAGAAHAPAPPHGYNVSSVGRRADGTLTLRVWPRIWSGRRTARYRPDLDNVADGEYAEHNLGKKAPTPPFPGQTARPKAFISYSHDSSSHRNRVLALADELQTRGIQIMLDAYVAGEPPRSWPVWTTEQIEDSQYLLVVCTEEYRARVEPTAPGPVVLGVRGEPRRQDEVLITEQVYESASKSAARCIPLLFDGEGDESVPRFLRASPLHRIGKPADWRLTSLVRQLTGEVDARFPEPPPPPDWEDIWRNYLQKELLDDQFINLEQAGHASDRGVQLEQVFFDLPVSSWSSLLRDNEVFPFAPSSNPGFIESMLRRFAQSGSSAESGAQPQQRRFSVSDEPDRLAERATRFVLIGGPGQGKTTLGQFLCQLFRAGYLHDCPQLEPPVRELVTALRTSHSAMWDTVASLARFPVRVVLSEFAETLIPADSRAPAADAGGASNQTLLEYLAHTIRRGSGGRVDFADVRELFRTKQAFIVLDGLDEVASSAADSRYEEHGDALDRSRAPADEPERVSLRERVLVAIREFLVATSGFDLFVIVTTRPQAYDQDLQSYDFAPVWLAALDLPRAVEYARRLTAVQYRTNERRKKQIDLRLARAANDSKTARLMTTPLQVTIMAGLAATLGDLPTERWKLFEQYYDLFYKREAARGTPPELADLLSTQPNRNHIDKIHRRTALLMQMNREQRGETRFSVARFREVVVARLREGDLEDTLVNSLAASIIEAALTRLVFLVGSGTEIDFELRSLQEFMTAECIMDGEDAHVRERLAEIAPLADWRNVLMFCVSRAFTTSEHLLGEIHTMCAGLNAGAAGRSVTHPSLDAVSVAGSRLALEVLEEGSAWRNPRFARLFWGLAGQLLDSPNRGYGPRLADIYNHAVDPREAPGLAKWFKDELARQIHQPHAVDAWLCALLVLARDGEGGDGFHERLRRAWPADVAAQTRLVEALVRQAGSDILDRSAMLRDRMAELQPVMPPSRLFEIVGDGGSTGDAPNVEVPEWAVAVRALAQRRDLETMLDVECRWGTDQAAGDVDLMAFRPLADDGLGHRSDHLPETGVCGRALQAEARFVADPSPRSLANCLRDLSTEVGPQDWVFLAFGAPWPLAACLVRGVWDGTLDGVARSAETGALGGLADWLAAERRWRERGIAVDELSRMDHVAAPFDAGVATYGAPYEASATGALPSAVIDCLVETWERHPAGRLRKYLARRLSRTIARSGELPDRLRAVPALCAFVREANLAHHSFLPWHEWSLMTVLQAEWENGIPRSAAVDLHRAFRAGFEVGYWQVGVKFSPRFSVFTPPGVPLVRSSPW